MRAMTMLLLLAAAASAQPNAAAPVPLRTIADQVSEQRLRQTVERLVGFGTRHTLSVRNHPTRGIGAALNWTEAEFRQISRGCGGCLEIVRPSDTVTNRRIPTPTLVEDVVAIQRGTTDPNRVIVITGHIDSRVTDVMNATADAPGANDDGSGTAAVIEAARVLSQLPLPGDDRLRRGLGRGAGAERQRDPRRLCPRPGLAGRGQSQQRHHRQFSCGSDGVCDDAHVRVFSEGVRCEATPELIAQQRSLGGENDSPSRNLSRFVDTLADSLALGLDVRQIWRTDRFGRGGDHIELPDARLPGDPLHRRHRELQLAAPGPAGPRTASSMATRSTIWTSPICAG